MAKEQYYPPVSFFFRVNVVGISGVNEGDFQEVSGLNIKLKTEKIVEGGENRFAHRLPSPPDFENLILKRGLVLDSALINWVKYAVEDFTFSPKTVIVNLMDRELKLLASWNFAKAYPVAYKIADLKAQENAIAFETLELCYDYFKRIK